MPPPNRHRLFLLILTICLQTASSSSSNAVDNPSAFREAPAFRNGRECRGTTIHISMTLDSTYLRGSVAGIFSVLQHAACPEDLVFHFIIAAGGSAHRKRDLRSTVAATFPSLTFRVYQFDGETVRGMISLSVRRALDQPLNYARIYLADLLPAAVGRIIYLDSDLIVVDDVAKLWGIDLGTRVLGAPEYCHANFTNYFNSGFWRSGYAASFKGRRACYFNTGVMVIDLKRWRGGKYTEKLEYWMRLQKKHRIYELGSLPPFLLVFAGNVEKVEHRWNQHGLGGDNLEGRCRALHPGPVSLLHWSGKGKPWLRIDSKRPCPLDSLWIPYDLFRRPSLLSDV